MVQPSSASLLVEGLCIYTRTESFCPYREVVGGCPPWFDERGLIIADRIHPISTQTVEITFRLWGKWFVENRELGWDWLCCPFRKVSEAAF